MERSILSDNPMWEAFGGRAVGRIVYGGADIGECRAAIEAVGLGGTDDWHRAWAAMADRLAAAGDESAAKGHDPGQGDQRDQVLPFLPLTDAQKAAFPNIDPSLLDGMAKALESPDADPMLHWKLIQRGLWVHGADTVFDLLEALVGFDVLSVAAQISCPTLLTAAEGDPTAKGGGALLAALTVPRKERISFTAAEGAGGHCEAFARALYHQRTFDWLDEMLGMSA